MRAEEGMTLIELLIAMTILAIGIAALVAGFSSGILSINRARLASTAAALADKQMELNQARMTGGGQPRQQSVTDQLHALADLRDRGAISDAEFEAKKAQLLDRL